MCGIAGFVDFSGRPVEELTAALDRMHAALRHRGPDGEGRVVLHGSMRSERFGATDVRHDRAGGAGPTVGLAHQRLAIIDLSEGGRQPIASSSRAGWLAYNGELYNYRDLGRDLVRRGLRLRSTSDAEVLAELMALDGPGALSRLRGMFAFAWWNETAKVIVLARDRFGIKPLVYTRPSPGFLLFASEPRALAASGYVHLEPSIEGVGEFLVRGSIGASGSFWIGVKAVAPGEWLTFDGDTLEAHSYWSLEGKILEPRPEAPVEHVARAVRPAFVESVEAHLVSDVPVAIFLSGGLDSTAVLAAAREVTSGPLQTFTVTMLGSALDETEHARSAARHFGSDHSELRVDDLDVDATLDEFFATMQTPSVDGLNTFVVARAARQAGVRVALSGVGADELFGGYRSFAYVPDRHRVITRYGPAARVAGRVLGRLSPAVSSKLATIFGPRSATPVELWWRARQVLDESDVIALTGRPGPRPPVITRVAAVFDQVRYCEFRHFLMSQLLRDADAFTMCRALELRTPFVDHGIVESTLSAGRWRRARGLSYKATLFRHLAGLALPAGMNRPKQGFLLPFDTWMREALTDPRLRRLGDLKQRLSHPRYRPFVTRFLERRLHWAGLWTLYVLERVGGPLPTGQTSMESVA